MVTFRKQVEVGRIVHIEEGKYKGKLAVIVNPISQKWVLIDGPNTGVPRQSINVRQIRLTKFVIKICHHSPSKVVKEAYASAEIDKKWSETQWAKKQSARLIRNSLNDFDRFKAMYLKRLRSKIIKRHHRIIATTERKSKAGKN